MTWLFAPAVALWLPAFAAAAAPAGTKLVVILYPENNNGSPGSALAEQGLRSTFATGSAGHVELYAEYLDVSHVRDAGQLRLQTEYLRQKYAGRKVDLVIAGLSSGLDFVLEHRADVFPGVPVVFLAVDEQEVKSRKLPPDAVGVPITMDLNATLDVALRLHPNTRRVYVVAGKSKMDASWASEARRRFQPYEGRVEFTYLVGLPLDELVRRVTHLPERSLVYYVHVFQDGDAKVLMPSQVLGRLAQATNAPIYGHVDTYVGRGAVGGRVFSFEAAGADAARVGLRILAGEKPEAIGVQPAGENSYLFDGRQLRHWGIDEDRLPPGSVVRYKESGFWELYKWPAIGVVSLCVVEALLISGLLVQRSSRRRVESALQASERRYRTLFEKANDAIFLETEDDGIVAANLRACELLGYSREELLSMTVPDLQAPEVRGSLGTVIKGELAEHAGGAFEALDVHRDGRRIPVEVTDTVIEEDGKRMVLSIVRDVTERKRADGELRDSQRELRELTGKLLVAQETERRRIARELHDDFSQGLALLSVDLDLLSQKPPGSDAGHRERLREMLARVKRLSSSVHDLSHQLHPARLEQLGLVAALRGLCQELTRGHGLPVEFSARRVPGAIPEDTALCLYRVAQEVLQNVVKHSGARHARVELTGVGDAIELRFADDGKGFDPAAAARNGRLGLVSMPERLRLVGGTIAIDSRPTAGTRIDVRVPWRPAAPADGEVSGDADGKMIGGQLPGRA